MSADKTNDQRTEQTSGPLGGPVEKFDPGDAEYGPPDSSVRTALDLGDEDYDSLSVSVEGFRPDDAEPEYPAEEPLPWAPDLPVHLHGGAGAAAAGSDVGQTGGDDMLDGARQDVEAAYRDGSGAGIPANTPGSFESAARDWAARMVDEPHGKEVEFLPPTAAEGPVPREAPAASEATDGAPAPDVTDVVPVRGDEGRDAGELAVIDGARASLLDREKTGEVLGGDPIGRADQWHPQGQNDRGYQNDCALAATSSVLRDCGVDVSESDVVEMAVDLRLCDTQQSKPADNGGVADGKAVSELMKAKDVASHIEHPRDVEELARSVEDGHGVIALVEANELWGAAAEDSPTYYDEAGRAQVDHAVQVTGTTRDSSGELTGIVVNDTGNPNGAAQVVPLERWDACWGYTTSDHETVVTDRPTAAERSRR